MMTSTNSVKGESPVKFAPQADRRAAEILARTMFKDMCDAGLDRQQILAVASELIARVTKDLRDRKDQ